MLQVGIKYFLAQCSRGSPFLCIRALHANPIADIHGDGSDPESLMEAVCWTKGDCATGLGIL